MTVQNCLYLPSSISDRISMRQPLRNIENGERPKVQSKASSLKPQQNTCRSSTRSTSLHTDRHQSKSSSPPIKAIAGSQSRPQQKIGRATRSDSLQPQQKSSKSNLHSPIMRPTNPSAINTLWSEVMSATRARSTASPRGSTETGSETGSQSSSDFYKLVLIPRGITINGSTNTILVSRHFSTSPPTERRAEYYQEKTGNSASRVWLEIDEEFVKEVVGEYTWMKTHDSCEAEFATYGKEVLIRRSLGIDLETREYG